MFLSNIMKSQAQQAENSANDIKCVPKKIKSSTMNIIAYLRKKNQQKEQTKSV